MKDVPARATPLLRGELTRSVCARRTLATHPGGCVLARVGEESGIRTAPFGGTIRASVESVLPT